VIWFNARATIMDRRTICEAQAAICREQADRDDSDRAFWLAEARRWQELAGEHVRAAVSVGRIDRAMDAQMRDRVSQMRDARPLQRN
jgi:hypothetical protein